MTREQAIGNLIHAIRWNDMPKKEALDMAVEALEQEPCEDAISRQAAIDAFERFIHELGIEDKPYNYGEMALSVRNVPPVNPQPKTGHWIHFASSDDCSECGWSTGRYISPSKYCPNCGARMEAR